LNIIIIQVTLDVKAALKKAVGLQDVVDDDTRRLATLRANVTEELAEIDEEEAMIRENLALVNQIDSTPDTVRRGGERKDGETETDRWKYRKTQGQREWRGKEERMRERER
jgi:hypothetical protein